MSEQHTNWGQSQLLAGILGRELDSFPVRLYNPTEETMFASILVYTAPRIQEPGNTEDYELDSEANEVFSEVFLGCLNVEITSHGAFELEDDFFFNDLEPNNGPNIINANKAINTIFTTPNTPNSVAYKASIHSQSRIKCVS